MDVDEACLHGRSAGERAELHLMVDILVWYCACVRLIALEMDELCYKC